MTAAAQTTPDSQVDWRVIVGGGAKLGVLTALGVAAFSILSGMTAGITETILQSVIVLIGMVVFSYLPSVFFRPSDVDTIAWTAMVGLLGSVFFTVIDTAVLRPLDMYHWTWDAIGGGSGFWYIPVWFMGAAVVAWFGGWIVANSGDENPFAVGMKTAVIGVIAATVIMVPGIVPFHAAGVALGFTIGLVIHIPLSAKMRSG